MRIKDLATRATKLLTGNAYMAFDNGTKVEKVDYAELAKQIITEYNTQTLAGSAQSVKSALDALNSKTPLQVLKQTTQNTAQTVTFDLSSDNRFTGILFTLSNAGGNMGFGVNYKTGISAAISATKLFGYGSASDVSISSDGIISVRLATWSQAILLYISA